MAHSFQYSLMETATCSHVWIVLVLLRFLLHIPAYAGFWNVAMILLNKGAEKLTESLGFGFPFISLRFCCLQMIAALKIKKLNCYLSEWSPCKVECHTWKFPSCLLVLIASFSSIIVLAIATRGANNNNFIPLFTSYNQFMYNVKIMAQPPGTGMA